MADNCFSDSIAKLKELTENLPPFPNILSTPACRGEKSQLVDGAFGFLDAIDGGYTSYEMNEGECFSWFIHRSGNDVAVHRWFVTRGTIFPEHIHSEKEWLIVYSGSMDILVDDKTHVVLKKGESYYVLPGVKHSSTYPEDCKFLTITIPPSKEFSNVR